MGTHCVPYLSDIFYIHTKLSSSRPGFRQKESTMHLILSSNILSSPVHVVLFLNAFGTMWRVQNITPLEINDWQVLIHCCVILCDETPGIVTLDVLRFWFPFPEWAAIFWIAVEWFYHKYQIKQHLYHIRTFKEWVSFFLGSWEMNRSAEHSRFTRDLFVPHCDSFPMNREKMTLIPYIYNASNKNPF